jgi:hypothetical protein
LSKRRTRRPALFLAAIALIAGGIVVAPTAASAQSGASDQYGGVGPAGGSDQEGDQGQSQQPTGNVGGGEAGTAESGGGSLPFTGYPLTPLFTLFLLLLAAGVVIRLVNSRRTAPTGSVAQPRLR